MLKVGVGEGDITPSAGSAMGCFPNWEKRKARVAVGVHDRLLAKALLMQVNDAEPVVICATDTPMLRRETIDQVVMILEKMLDGFSAERIVFTSTHTHSGAESTWLFSGSWDSDEMRILERGMVDSVVAAWNNRRNSYMEVGCVNVDLTHNRRVVNDDGKATMYLEYQEGMTEGVVDPEIKLMRFIDASDGSTSALVYNFASHALTLGTKNMLYTADFPGEVRRLIEPELNGGHVIFLNGAAGDIHPKKCMRDDFSAMTEIGAALAEKLREGMRSMRKLEKLDVAVKKETMNFPNRVDPAIETKVELTVIEIGDVVMGFVPGEFFVRLQLNFKKALPDKDPFFIGYADDWVGYVPTQDEYEYGGYGVDLCATDEPRYSRTSLPEGAGEKILETLIGMV